MNQNTQTPDRSVKFNWCGCEMEIPEQNEPRLPTPEEIYVALDYASQVLVDEGKIHPDEMKHALAQEFENSLIAVWDVDMFDKCMVVLNLKGKTWFYAWYDGEFEGDELKQMK